MNPLTVINAAANVIVAGAVADLALRVFGRPDHPSGDPAKTHKGASAISIRGKRPATRQDRSV
jgi:hypothetical protein